MFRKLLLGLALLLAATRATAQEGTNFHVVPATAAPVTSLSGIVTLSFDQVESLFLSRKKIYVYDESDQPLLNADDQPLSFTLSLGDLPNTIKFNITPAITTEGQYQFVIPAGSLIDDDTNKPLPEVRFTYTVSEAAAGGGVWTVSPSLTHPVPSLKGEYVITLLPYAEKGLMWGSLTRICNVFIYKEGMDLTGRPLIYYGATYEGNQIRFTASPAITTEGSYILNISGFLEADTQNDIDDINIPFTLTGDDPEPPTPEEPKIPLDQTFTLSPSNAEPLASLTGRIDITFPHIPSFSAVGGFISIQSTTGVDLSPENGDYIRLRRTPDTENAGYIDLEGQGLAFTTPGTYTFTIPKHSFLVDSDAYDKEYVDPFTFSYTIAAPTQGEKVENILFKEDFDADFAENFPTLYDGDGQMPDHHIQAFFLSAAHGYYMPWQPLRESSADPDRFISSHAYYDPVGTSDDWLVSRAITVPTTGFLLEFDAQSLVLREGERLSTLKIFLAEELPSAQERPSEPDFVIADVPAGASPDVTTNEWTHYAYSLDAWVGKKVHLCFVNQNTDKDLLCLNNIKVSRYDDVEVALEALPQYVAEESITLRATVHAMGSAVPSYVATFSDGTTTQTLTATEPLRLGETRTLTATFPLAPCQLTHYTFTLTPADALPIERATSTTRLAFRPHKRVLLEETTGLWCGNCPRATYNIESLKEDPQISDDVIPVSVHISGSTPDLLAQDAYAEFLGLAGGAPLVRLDRGSDYLGFTPAYDSAYDPSQPASFAYRVFQQRDRLALFDIDLNVEPVVEEGDTIEFQATATVRPALPNSGERYRVGFILTENNVGLDNSPWWTQENNLAGMPYESTLGGWTLLPREVENLRYHYVARALPHPTGIEGSLPKEMQADETYVVASTLQIPITEQRDRQGNLVAPAIRPAMCEITAYVIDATDLSIQNAVRRPLTPQALELFTAQQLADGVHPVSLTPAPLSPACYDLQGRRLPQAPRHGVYILNGKKIVR